MRTVLSNRIARVDGCMKEGNKVVDGRTIRIKRKKERKKEPNMNESSSIVVASEACETNRC